MTETDIQERKTLARHLGICLAAVSAAMVVIWPVADLPFGDDTAYTDMALNLARTGHMAYNGWEAVVQILHTYWAALAIELFGFSFLTVRLSTIPYALGSVALCYLLVRRAGLTARAALFVTLLLGLSPLFLPVSLSYMTDVPGLFFTFASLYSLARAEEIAGEPKSYGWLALGAAAGLIGGTGRQIVWLVPLVVLPYLAWVRRSHWWFRLCAEAAWVAVLAGVNYTMAWFRHQPYTVFQPSVLSEMILTVERPFRTAVIAARLSLMLVLLILPATVPLVFRSAEETWRGPRGRKILVAALLLMVMAAIAIHPSLASIPWISNTLNWEGIYGSGPLPGRPIVLTTPIRAVVAVTVYFSVCILAGELWNIRRMARRISELLIKPSSSEFLLAAMSLFSAAYFALVLVRGADFDIFDRYLLPVMPWAATVALLWFAKDNLRAEETVRRAAPYAWVLLGVLAFYGIASTQDLWALAKARVEATRTLEAAGVPRTAIDAGFEYNAWTELMTSGHLNFYLVKNPPGAYRPGLSQTPSVVPQYRLEYEPTPETAASKFGSVPYSSLLPPFHKQVSIDRVLPTATSAH
ncbi:MAG TPA: glycosyltransferase family 39 protein [Candidatus Sulfotelmatobacter sp.]|nr:glycosyltransferase family 39 protein [Candidatus Sulfotelmatobacter sp.]